MGAVGEGSVAPVAEVRRGTRSDAAKAGGETRQRTPRGWWRWATGLVPMALAASAVRLWMVAVPPYDRAVGLFDDDAYYYFRVARNLARGAGSTFNGIDLTNGYHPVWQALLVPVFAVADGRAALVLVTVVSSVLYVCSAVLLQRIGQHCGHPALVVTCATPLLVSGVVGPSFWFSGMETGLLLTALLALSLLYLRRMSDTQVPRRGSVLVLGAAMALVVLARLDAVFPMLVLGLATAATWWRFGVRRCLILTGVLAAPAAATLAAYLAGNLAVFGTALPVSGQAKALGGGGFNAGVVAQFLSAPVVFGQELWVGLAALVVALVALWTTPRGSSLRSLMRLGVTLLVGGVLTVGYYAATSSWTLWAWYFYAAPLSLVMTAPGVLVRLPLPQMTWRRAASVAPALVVLLVAVTAGRLASGGVTRAAFVENGPVLAARLAAVAPVDAPMAMGDRAGSVGFHLRRPLIHLEGLVESAGYLRALQDGRVPDFLAQRGVGFYARGDASPGAPEPAAGAGCRRFVEPQQGAGPKADIVVCAGDLVVDVPLSDGTAYRVWRYRPELNP